MIIEKLEDELFALPSLFHQSLSVWLTEFEIVYFVLRIRSIIFSVAGNMIDFG